jgi:VacB/RNase II family 3'-5' exoribonuclease
LNSRSPPTSDLLRIAKQAMTDNGLRPDFDSAALAQLASINNAATTTDTAVRDLRTLLWASIDNDSSRDLDQLTVAIPASDGATTILVAIADVDAVVQRGSPIDVNAQFNTTSVYTAAATFPMLPEKLSTDLTSLGQDKDRLAIVIEMTISALGVVNSSEIYRALVFNRAKLAYNSVAAWLDGKEAPPTPVGAVSGMDAQLRLQDEIAQALRKVRRSRGALELQTLEAEPVFSLDALADLRFDEDNRAKQLIEEFMVAANGVTARFLSGKKVASLRRVLPVPKHWDRIVALAAAVGEQLPPEPNAVSLNAFLSRRRAIAPTLFSDLSLSIVKLLGAGEYDADLPGQTAAGHFALAVADYAHSTAPNRRYPDLATQRLLKAALSGAASPYTNAELQELAAHCTQQERNAAKVERSVNKSAAAVLLASRIGARFDAIVTGASDKGTWVRISSPTTEGRVVRGFEGLAVGDHVKVELVHTDVSRGFIDFAKAQ